jgi:L-fuconolactonase
MESKIVDTHIHIWDLAKVRYEWLEGDSSILNRTYSFEELLPAMQEAGVNAGILVQAANNEDDTHLMLSVAKAHSQIKGIVGWLPLTEPRNTRKKLEEDYTREQLFKGVRHLIHNEPDPRWLLQDSVMESLAILASFNIPFDIVGINDAHLQTALEVAEKIPDLNFVLDHMNQPPISSKSLGSWGELISQIALHPNAHIKISGLGTASGNPTGWERKDIQPYIEFALQKFGVDRCFCGGDWPVSLLAGSYKRHWKIYRELLSDLLGLEEAQKVLWNNACVFYNLN